MLVERTSKERVKISLGAYMNRSEKSDLMVIEKSQNPRKFPKNSTKTSFAKSSG